MRLPALGLVLMLGAWLPATAEDGLETLFMIRDVEVDETARDALRAREQALRVAEDKAWDKVIDKLTRVDDRDKLPPLSFEERRRYVSGIEVLKEQASSNRYVASLNVRFEPELMIRLFTENGVGHVLSLGQPLLVLHGHTRGIFTHFLSEDATLLAARDRVDWVNRLRPYIWPAATEAERESFSWRQIVSGNQAHMAPHLRSYGVPRGLVIQSSWTERDGMGSLAFRAYESDGTEELLSGVTEKPVGPKAEEDAIAEMYDAIIGVEEKAWRQSQLVDAGATGSIEADVAAERIETLLEIERRLDRVTLVTAHRRLTLALPLSRIALDFAGREEQLIVAMKQVGLEFVGEGESRRITLTGAGRE
ncbi:hypothetical protein [Gimibacter soli]|uniref:DUF2066 domain-containing protein n=1 Tax=Gimibacter soli TaxID=3024400 RepID=A0AAE9XU94_9PROT|nr:hypothetical protein [Gimibacter soli]WCL52809.1 hypothetical protein PH603_09685 [Gimibacter soli]